MAAWTLILLAKCKHMNKIICNKSTYVFYNCMSFSTVLLKLLRYSVRMSPEQTYVPVQSGANFTTIFVFENAVAYICIIGLWSGLRYSRWQSQALEWTELLFIEPLRVFKIFVLSACRNQPLLEIICLRNNWKFSFLYVMLKFENYKSEMISAAIKISFLLFSVFPDPNKKISFSVSSKLQISRCECLLSASGIHCAIYTKDGT